MVYYGMEPWGDERADLRAGVIASTIANANRAKGQRAFKPADFMLKFDKPVKRKQTPQEMWAVLMAGTKAHNAARARRG